jgi:Tol biopolymer transport system component
MLRRTLAGVIVGFAVVTLLSGLSGPGEASTRLSRQASNSIATMLPPNQILLVRGNDLYVLDPGESRLHRLTKTPEREAGPAVSRDGRKIAFSRDGDIWVMSVNATNQRRLTHRGTDGEPAWSADGALIFFSRLNRKPDGFSMGIMVVRADGRPPRRLTDPEPSDHGTCHSDPAPSPDGRVVAFAHFGDCEHGVAGPIAAVDMSGRPVSMLQRFDRDLSAFDPDWSPDGSAIAFAVQDLNFAVDDNTKPDRSGIYIARPDGSRARRLSARSWPSGPSWSPDGEWLAFVHDVSLDTGYAGEIWIVRRDGTGLRRVTRTSAVDEASPDWLPLTSG